ncbi:MAG: BlaI/MecI/CopY family transcriptional regulator [Acidobacteriota bacterium]|nr:BlaI/MecI/CopY family transcriptional regulator [Acidobacteriota bacterium]
MPRQHIQKPTEAELEILSILWQRETATVREVYEIINERRPTAYTTVLKMLQIMTEKNLVERETEQKAHIYRAKIEQAATERSFAEDLLDRVFGGSAAQLMMRVLETKPASNDELTQIRQMLDEAERKER